VLQALGIVLCTATLATLTRAGGAFWLCVPASLLIGTLPLRRAPATITQLLTLGAASGPLVALHVRPLPSPAFAIVIPAAAVAILAVTRHRLEQQRDALRDVALRDPLTGLANRRLLMARAEYEIARHTRDRQRFVVVMLDLDGFKLLNDRFGHAAGDELLCDVGEALTQAIRAQDTVARLGGDEFCVLAPDTDHHGVPRLTNRIARALAHATAGIETLRASAGTAVFPDDGATAAQLLAHADAQLLAIKRERHGRARRRAA
jgi:diguanylate cyclase (GGDEF)-like protein